MNQWRNALWLKSICGIFTRFIIEIPDEIKDALLEAECQEKNYIRRRFYNKAHYSLDADDGIEKDILFVSLSPCEIYERKITAEQLHSAIASLPYRQGKRRHKNRPLLRRPVDDYAVGESFATP